MKIAQIPSNEVARLRALNRLKILDTVNETHYDTITQLASYVCGTKSSVISLVDENRQWFKSTIGIDICETGRDVSFCAHAINNPKHLMEVPDATLDPRFHDNPLVTDNTNPVIFYAGVPLKDNEGHAIGTLCVLHNKPKKLKKKQRKALQSLALQVEELLKLRALNNELELSRKHLKRHNDLLKDFAGTVSHDMKMPLANLIVTSDLLSKKYDALLDSSGKKYLKYLKQSSLSLSDYISNILTHYEASSYDLDDRVEFHLNDLLEEIMDLLDVNHDCEINFPDENLSINCNKTALEQIFINLLVNSIKYNDKETTVINITSENSDTFYRFSVKDNGRGIPADKIDTIFELFKTSGEPDRDGKKGHGIGLTTVKQLVEDLDGSINVQSHEKVGTTFTFTIKK
ncbi:ATPase [Nonlabens spongiae]|uniref:histidine kinase n=1 Tax=Nonlabens spongiae TaxID=331648 RepID=A0A1W6MMI6_9FLAO|nr:GAF domain-containing sensor histidine kinase [Nonlabens spongiae]ARN78808.1 ATPase [Nonlabens spongiae]